jgi:iron complex transport system substrate-binding protein
MARLLEIGAPLLAMNPRSLADIYADIELLGRITGRAAAVARVVRRMKSDLGRIAARSRLNSATASRHHSKPRVYCEAWPNPRISSPLWVAELISMVGGTPAVPAGQRVRDEQVAAARPDVVILAWTATGGKSDPRRALENPAWGDVPAIRSRRVFVIRDELLNTPSPILVRGASELARAIHAADERP